MDIIGRLISHQSGRSKKVEEAIGLIPPHGAISDAYILACDLESLVTCQGP